MAMKNAVEVVIGGKVYKISGYESSEYLHQIAVYINDKMTEFQNMDSYRKQTMDQKQLMLNMNLADEFFKAKRQADKLSAELEKKERELYSVRHDLIEARLALENLQKEQKEKEQEEQKEQNDFEKLMTLYSIYLFISDTQRDHLPKPDPDFYQSCLPKELIEQVYRYFS